MSTVGQDDSSDDSVQSGPFDVSDTSEGDGSQSNISMAPNTVALGTTTTDKKEDSALHNTTDRGPSPPATRTVEQTHVHKEPDEDGELEVLLCLLEQRLSASVDSPTHEQNQQLWETLRSLVPKYRDRTRRWRSQTAELEQRLEESKQECLRKCEKLLDEHRGRLKAVTEDYEKQHMLALERAGNARQQAESLLLQLADAQAEIKCLKAQMQTKVQELKSEHLRVLLEVTNEKDLQLRVKGSECQEAVMLNRNLQQQNRAYKTRLETEVAALLQQKAELEARLKAQESLNQELMSVLEKERSLNQELTSAVGHHENKVAILEHQLYALQSEGKHKDLLVQALSSKVSQDIALAASTTAGSSSHSHSQQPQATSGGTSTAGSSSADSGVQVSMSCNRSRGEEVSVSSVASQVSPQAISAELDQTLQRLTSQINEKNAAVLEAKRLLRSTTNELHKLTKLAEQRAEHLRRLQSRMQSSSTVASTPGGYEYKGSSSNGSASHARMGSAGFVPHTGPPSFSKTVRKTYMKKLASTAEESLADVPSIEHNSTTLGGNVPPFEFHSEDTFGASDDVFEFSWLHEKSPEVANGTGLESQHPFAKRSGASVWRMHQLADGPSQRLQEGSRMPDPVLKMSTVDNQTRPDRRFSVGSKRAMPISDKALDIAAAIIDSPEKADPKGLDALGVASIETVNPVQKTISRSPWERGPSWKSNGTNHTAHSTASHNYLLMGNDRVWAYGPSEEESPAVKPAQAKPGSFVPSGGKKGARRSLHFPEEATVPFTFYTGANSDASVSASYELPFRSQPLAAPLSVTVNLNTYPERKDFHR
ncbi:uncharacterized protein LOC144174363 [Haemaphysalis longicornis]